MSSYHCLVQLCHTSQCQNRAMIRTHFLPSLLIVPALLLSVALFAQTGGQGVTGDRVGDVGRMGTDAEGQASMEDMALVRNQRFSKADEFAHYHGPTNNEKALQNKHRSVIAQYNPVSLVLKGALLG